MSDSELRGRVARQISDEIDDAVNRSQIVDDQFNDIKEELQRADRTYEKLGATKEERWELMEVCDYVSDFEATLIDKISEFIVYRRAISDPELELLAVNLLPEQRQYLMCLLQREEDYFSGGLSGEECTSPEANITESESAV
ncbi:MAG: hypothetical protein LUG99_09260 [Lachnospiraceae bacterium]|nr:hypothetical protein [Lachnospiraceae bacterium]